MQGMRDLLQGSLARSLRTLSDDDRLAAALPLVCGSALAAHCEVDRLDGAGTLHLLVRGRDWLGPLLSMRDVLQRDLARTAGVTLQAIHFELERPTPSRTATASAAEAPGAAGLPPRPRAAPRGWKSSGKGSF